MMLRRTITATAMALLMGVGLLSATPPSTAAIKVDNRIGFVTAPHQTWKPGCARYLVRWNLNPPTPDWLARAQFWGPPGRLKVHHVLLDASVNPERGQKRITLCGNTARPGRYTIQTTMTYQRGRDNYTRRSEPVHFRLVRR